jgi:Family of unknown function (DUF6281)
MRLAVTAAVLAVVAGCGGDQTSDDGEQPHVAAECSPQVRFQGTIYDGLGYSVEPVTNAGRADAAACSDVGRDALGSYYPPNPRQVEVFAFEGFPTSEVIGVKQVVDGRLGVFVAQHVPPAKAGTIMSKLSEPASR